MCSTSQRAEHHKVNKIASPPHELEYQQQVVDYSIRLLLSEFCTDRIFYKDAKDLSEFAWGYCGATALHLILWLVHPQNSIFGNLNVFETDLRALERAAAAFVAFARRETLDVDNHESDFTFDPSLFFQHIFAWARFIVDDQTFFRRTQLSNNTEMALIADAFSFFGGIQGKHLTRGYGS